MALALRMGRTVGELLDTMSAAELLLWRAYDDESPISDRRGDVLAAQVAAAVQSQGQKVGIGDLLMDWSPAPDEEGGDGGASFMAAMVALAAAPE